jgi:hypothetical protein
MCSRAGVRSVAAMRPSLLRLTAAAGATAAVLATSSSARAADAVYGGTAGSGDPIVVKADPKASELRSVIVSWRAACADGMGYPGSGELTPTEPTAGFAPGPLDLLISRNAKGRFKGTQHGSADLGDAVAAVVVDVEGKLKGTRASGTLSAVVKIADKATGADITSCQTGTRRWAASRAPGIVYGGVTSQNEPMVVRLNARRQRVNDVITTWVAPCTQGFFRVPEHFVNFAVKSTGRFGNPFSADFPMDAGGNRRYAYSITGRVTKAAAKGTLQVKVSETDANGATTDGCDTGGVTWKAATG